MFCTKLKDLKITGECPFSLLTQSQDSEEHEEECAGVPISTGAALPICTDVGEKSIAESLPQRKSSRTRVYLHTLAESLRKLIFPEFERLYQALQRTLARHKGKESRSPYVNLSFHGFCGSPSQREDFESVLIEKAISAGVPVDTVKETLGEELFKICYEEDEHVLEVVGGSLKDFLNSFTTHLKQGAQGPEAEEGDASGGAAIICLEKDQNFFNVYYFFPKPITALIFPGIMKAAARVLYETETEVRQVPSCFQNDVGEFSNQPFLLYTVHMKNTKPSLSPCKPQSSVVIPASLFCKTFPFHFMFDKEMAVLQIGNGIKRLLNKREFPGKTTFEEHFEILSPKIGCSFSGIMTMLNMQFTIKVKRWGNPVEVSSKVRSARWRSN